MSVVKIKKVNNNFGYKYIDENGKLIFEVTRDSNRFLLKRYHNDGRKHNILYKEYEICKSDKDRPVIFVEGEIAVENLMGLGFLATTNLGGAANLKNTNLTSLHNRKVVILPDNDEVSIESAKKLAVELLGKAVEVKMIMLPDLAKYEDISDWLERCGTKEQLEKIISDTKPLSKNGKV